jgi:hypothetical protein
MKAVLSALSFVVSVSIAVPGYALPGKCIGIDEEYTWNEAINHFLHTAFRLQHPDVQQFPLRRWVDDIQVNMIGNWTDDALHEFMYNIKEMEEIAGLKVDVTEDNGNIIAYMFSGEPHIVERLIEDIHSVTLSADGFKQASDAILREKVGCWLRVKADGGVIDRGIIYILEEAPGHIKLFCIDLSLMEIFGLNGSLPENYRISSIKNGPIRSNGNYIELIDKCALSMLYSEYFWPGIGMDRVFNIIEKEGRNILSGK